MILTLYEDVELRSDYSVVFDCDVNYWTNYGNTPFAQYLASKTQQTVNIEHTYLTTSGTIGIDWPTFSKYHNNITYMKLSDADLYIEGAPTRMYFFVDSCDYVNGMVNLSYHLDIWHTYSDKMNLYDGVINRAKLGYLRRRALPLEYTSNSPLFFNPIGNNTGRFYVACEYSVFILQSGDAVDDAPFRYNYTSLVSSRKYSEESETPLGTLKPPRTLPQSGISTYTKEEAIEVINKLTAYQGVKPQAESGGAAWLPKNNEVKGAIIKVLDKFDLYSKFITPAADGYSADTSSIGGDSDRSRFIASTRYEIIQFFLIPADFIEFPSGHFKTIQGDEVNASLLILDTYSYYDKVINGSTKQFLKYDFTELEFHELRSQTEPARVVQPYELEVDAKTVGLGFRSLFIPYSYNGLKLGFNIVSTFSPVGFDLTLETHQGYIPITDQFEVPIPFTTLNSTERELAALNRQSAKRQKALAIASTAAQVVGAGAGIAAAIPKIGDAYLRMAQSGATAFTASETASELGGFTNLVNAKRANYMYGLDKTRFGSAIGSGLSGIGQAGIGMLYSVNNILQADQALKSPISAGQANNGTANPIINAYYGLGLYQIQPDNEDEVNHMIERTGYNVFIKYNDYHHGLTQAQVEGKYEPIQFATVQVSGPMANNIRAALEEILLSGTIIAYDKTVFSDL